MNNQEQNTENQSVELSIKSDGLDARVVIKGEGFYIVSTLCSCMEQDKALEAIIMVAAKTYKEVNAVRILKRILQ